MQHPHFTRISWSMSYTSALPRAYLGILLALALLRFHALILGSSLHLRFCASMRSSWDLSCLGASVRLSWDLSCLGASMRLSWDLSCISASMRFSRNCHAQLCCTIDLALDSSYFSSYDSLLYDVVPVSHGDFSAHSYSMAQAAR